MEGSGTCEYCGKGTMYDDLGGPGAGWIHPRDADAKACRGPPPVGDGYDLPKTLRAWKMTKAQAKQARDERWPLSRYFEHLGVRPPAVK